MPDAPSPRHLSTFDLDDVLYAIVRVGQRIEHLVPKLMTTEGLGLRQLGILAQFTDRPATTAAEIARALDVTPQSIGPQIETLCERGLLSRRPVPGRGRPIEVRLTRKGRATLNRSLELADAEHERLTSHMTAAERTTMARQLQLIAERIEET